MNRTLIILVLLVLTVQPTFAQFGNLLGKAIERAAQRKAEQAVEKKVEETIDNVLSPPAASEKTNTTVKNEKDKVVINTEESEITVEDDKSAVGVVKPSPFIGSYTMTIATTEKGVDKGDPIVSKQFIEAFQVAMEMNKSNQKDNIHIIFDRRDRTMTTLSTDKKGNKTGVKMKMPKTTVKTKNSTSSEKPVRTSETKTINGYLCTKYTSQDDKYNSEFWVAETINFDAMLLAETMNMSMSKNDMANGQHIKGLAMQTIMRSKDPKKAEVITMTVSNLISGSVDSSKFSTNGYEIQDMSSMPFFGNGR